MFFDGISNQWNATHEIMTQQMQNSWHTDVSNLKLLVCNFKRKSNGNALTYLAYAVFQICSLQLCMPLCSQGSFVTEINVLQLEVNNSRDATLHRAINAVVGNGICTTDSTLRRFRNDFPCICFKFCYGSQRYLFYIKQNFNFCKMRNVL